MIDYAILGLDPGFSNIGFAVARLTASTLHLERAGVFNTAPSDKKRKVLSTDDNFRRAKEISEFLSMLCAEFDVKLICAESMSYPPSASAAAKMAMCWGALAMLSYKKSIPLIQASPQEIKLNVCGSKSASKLDVENAVQSHLDIDSHLVKVPRGKREHAFDAGAAILTSLLSPTVAAVRPLLAP